MAHFAKVNLDTKLVEQVIVAEQSFVDRLPGTWVQTSYNTHGGVHLLGGTPFRKNFAGVGYTFKHELDAFIPPQPYESWELNEDTCLWEAPVARPNDGKLYDWDEESESWKLKPQNN